MNSENAMLKIDNLHVRVDGKEILSGVTLAVRPGEVHAIMGPNGSGKSTLAHVLAGRPGYEITAGKILYEGRDVTGRPPYSLARLGLIRTFQLSSEFARLTVTENLLVAAPGQRATTFRGALLGKRYWRGQQAELGLAVDAVRRTA